MNKLSSKILEKIRKEKMAPKPRWYFILMHILLGTAILTSILTGAIAVAIVIRHFTVTDWEIARHFAGGNLRSLFVIMPYIWIIFIGLTILLADILFRHTKKGYQTELWKLVAGSIALSVFLGSLCYLTQTDKPIAEGLKKNLPPYARWEMMRNQVFAAPEKGVLAGKISEIPHESQWIVIDFRDKKWLVDISEARRPLRFTFVTGMQVGMIGEMVDQAHFKAIRVSPWERDEAFPAPPVMMRIKINERNY